MIGGREKKNACPQKKVGKFVYTGKNLSTKESSAQLETHLFFFFSHAIHCSLSIFTIGCSLISHLVQHNTALAHMYNNPAQHCVMYSMQSPKESKNTSEEDPAPKLVFEEEKKKTALVSLEKPRQKCWLYLSPVNFSSIGKKRKKKT